MGSPQPRKKTGLLGGSFDPIHSGHLIIAYDAMESLGLDEVFFIPAAQAPLKLNSPAATVEQRKDMVERAIDTEPAFRLLDYELQNPTETSYTIDTVRQIQDNFQDREFIWILGMDQFEKLPHWKDIEDLCELVEFAVLARKGTPFIPPKIRNIVFHVVSGHPIAISSTEIRERCQRQLPVHPFLPNQVHQYILQNHLYRN
jgi:nicotinate-nucleotide adenylyltransferase